MKIVVFVWLLFLIKISSGQSLSPSVQELVDAENSFSALSKKQNTRDAFVAHLAEDGIVFEKSNPVFGRKIWTKRKADSSLLVWWPTYSDVSLSGDFGYNTGPYEWSADRINAKPVAFGYFSSVWKKEKDGIWKVAIDMGIKSPSEEGDSPALTTSKIKPVSSSDKMLFSEAREELLEEDRRYVDQLNRYESSFIVRQLSDEVRIHRTGHYPVISKDLLNTFADSRDHYHFWQLGGDMASSGDMAFTYGRVKASNKADKKQVVLNYLRVWKKEDGENWRIVLDVIGG